METDEEKHDKNFEKIKAIAEIYYSSVEEVDCPYFNDTVAFNVKGLKHIKFKKDSVAGSRADQFMRLNHIKFAQRILEKSKTLQEYKQVQAFEVKQVGGGKPFFWSIIPFWTHNKELKMYSGDIEED